MNGSNEEDNDDDDNWTVDVSEEAIKARQVEGLSQGIKGKDKSPEVPFHEITSPYSYLEVI
jgi:hypothetical protein